MRPAKRSVGSGVGGRFLRRAARVAGLPPGTPTRPLHPGAGLESGAGAGPGSGTGDPAGKADERFSARDRTREDVLTSGWAEDPADWSAADRLPEPSPESRWPRVLRLLLVGAILVSGAIAVGVSIAIFEAQQVLGRATRYNLTWVTSQAPSELLRLERTIAMFGTPGFDVDKDEVDLRFDILNNRVDLLRRGDMVEFAQRNPQATETIDAFAKAMAEVAPLLERIDQPGQASAALRILIPFEARLSALAGLVNQDGGALVGEDQQRLTSLHAIFGASAIALVLSGLALVGQLFVQNRMIRRAHQDLARLARSRRQAQKMEVLGRLTGGIAHDFNNHLLALQLSLDDIGLKTNDAPDVAASLHIAQNASENAQALTSQLLAFGRRQTLRPAVLDANAVLSGMAGMLERILPAPIQIRTKFASPLPPISIDRNQLETAIVNLVVNARDAMPDGGSIVLETDVMTADASVADASVGDGGLSPGRYVTIAVHDSGTGMSPAVVQRAFEPFFTTKPVGKGTGLGLSQVYGFIRQSGGGVRIDSRPGGGTTVLLALPSDLPAGSAMPERQEETAAARGGPEVILVVEDNLAVGDAVLSMLSSLGYTAILAENGDAALAIIEDGRPLDLLFTDVMLPGSLNGARLAIEARRRRPGLSVMVTTGYTDTSLPDMALLGDVPILPKPYKLKELARALRQAMEPGTKAAPRR